MSTHAPLGTSPAPRVRQRLIEVDVVRAVALIGVVVMNYYGYMVLRGGDRGHGFAGRLFDTVDGPLTTRFAATFVLVAGAGVSLMTNASRRSGVPRMVADDRWRLIRRGVLLYGAGYVLDWIWAGTILFYYGAMFVAAAFLFTLRIRWIAAIGAGAAVAAAAIQWWAWERRNRGHDTSWLFSGGPRSPRSLLFDTFVNGTHPLLPWLAFLCAGMILGRLLPLRPELKMTAALGGVTLAVLSHVVDDAGSTTPLRSLLLSTSPWHRGLVYTIGTLGSSVAAFVIVGALAGMSRNTRVTRALAAAGRTTLSVYVLHVLVFNLALDQGWVRPTGLDTALVFAGCFWVIGIVSAAAWQRHMGMGPLERVYRRFGG